MTDPTIKAEECPKLKITSRLVYNTKLLNGWVSVVKHVLPSTILSVQRLFDIFIALNGKVIDTIAYSWCVYHPVMYENLFICLWSCLSLFVAFRFPSEEHMDDVAGTVFIGGLSAGSTIPYEHIRNPDYVGCMRDLFINGKRVHLSGEDQQRQSHNVEDGCNLELLRSGDTECERERCVDLLSGTECEREGYIDFLLNSRPYCDCALPSSNCTGELAYINNMYGFC